MSRYTVGCINGGEMKCNNSLKLKSNTDHTRQDTDSAKCVVQNIGWGRGPLDRGKSLCFHPEPSQIELAAVRSC